MSSDIKKVDLSLAIPLRHLGDEDNAIDRKLNSLISQYVAEVDGVLIKWNDLIILNDQGIILDEQPYVFWKITFTAQVFKPIEGKLVKGKINQILKCYFLAKAMNSFTVTVTIPEALSENKIVKNLMLDQEVYFKIKGSSAGVYRGELDEECLDWTSNSTREERKLKEKDVFNYAKGFEF